MDLIIVKKHVQGWTAQRTQAVICTLIFGVCLFVYLMNGQYMGTADNYPNTLLAFNWLFNHDLTLAAKRDLINPAFPPHYFVQSLDGQWVSKYPIGPAIVTFPIYFCFFIYLKVLALGDLIFSGASPAIDIFARDFERSRQEFESGAGAIAASLSVVLFYLCARLKVSQGVSIIATFIFAFATSTWTISSQGVWQHTTASLVLLAAMLCLLKANRKSGSQYHLLLGLAGFFCGLLPGCRPTSLLFVMAMGLYVLYTHGLRSCFFMLGLLSIFLSIAWNTHFFGWSYALSGGYSIYERTYYKFTLEQFKIGFFGVLLSPSKGWVWGCPVMLFAIPGAYQVWRQRGKQDENLFLLLGLACGGLFLNYCFYVAWHGAIAYGPSRFMTDTLPVMLLFIAYFLEGFRRWSIGQRQAEESSATPGRSTPRSPLKRVGAGLVLVSLVTLTSWSMFVQAVGAFGNHTHWILIPTKSATERVWKFEDNSILRTWNSLKYKIASPIQDAKQYRDGFQGTLQTLSIADRPMKNDRITMKAGRLVILKADLLNTGSSEWYGYETGMDRDIAMLSVYFYDQDNQQVPRQQRKSTLYISGNVAPGEIGKAVGDVKFPPKSGNYKAVFQIERRRRPISQQAIDDAYTVDVVVK